MTCVECEVFLGGGGGVGGWGRKSGKDRPVIKESFMQDKPSMHNPSTPPDNFQSCWMYFTCMSGRERNEDIVWWKADA